jgi:KilA-N domain
MADNIVQKFDFASTTIRKDGLVNATALTTAYRNATGIRKDAANWLKTKEAKDSIAYLEQVTGIPVTDLVSIPRTKVTGL